MSFTVEDFQDLVQLLDERPQWQSELRRRVLSDEYLALPEQLAEFRREVDEQIAELRRDMEQRFCEVEKQIAELRRDTEGVVSHIISSLESRNKSRRWPRDVPDNPVM